MSQIEIKPSIYFERIPLPYNASLQSNVSYKINIRMPDLKDHYVDLYSYNSSSYPLQTETVFSNLIPQWRFIDLSGNNINRIQTTDTIIKNDLGEIIGIEGYAEFYYIDDMPSPNNGKCPLYLYATVDTRSLYVDYSINKDVPGFSNSKIVAVAPQYIFPNEPDFIGISFNGDLNNPINDVKWVGKNLFATFTVCSSAQQLSGVTIFNYPSSNSLGELYEIDKKIINLEENEIWIPYKESSNYFKHDDLNTGFLLGGFSRQYCIPSISALNCQISAKCTVQYERPYDIIDFYEERDPIFVSNPTQHAINGILSQINISSCAVPEFTYETITNLDYISVLYNTPSCKNDGIADYCYSDGFGIAVEPSGVFWYVDTEFDMLVKHDYYNDETLLQIDLLPSSSPFSLSLDSNKNVWVSLFDEDIICKYNNDGSFLLSSQMPSNFIAPYGIVADQNDDIYVTCMGLIENSAVDLENLIDYSEAFPENIAGLLKFDSSGNYLASYDIPVSGQPQDVLIDVSDNSVWVVNSFDNILIPHNRSEIFHTGCVQKWSTSTTTPITSIYYPRPEFITQDKDNGIWGTYGYGNIFYIKSLSEAASSFVIINDTIYLDTSSHNYDNYILGEPIPGYTAEFNEMLEGIAADKLNKIWVINTEKNKIYSFDKDDPLNTFNTFKLQGKGAIQALGDWTGFQWTRKYNYTPTPRPFDTIIKEISGISNIFDILDFSKNYNIRKFNDSWSGKDNLYKYVFPNFMREFTVLWNDFLGQMLGGDENNSLSRVMFEKIANFVDNNGDIDTCNIQQFYSMAQMSEFNIDNFKLNYPYEFKNILDLFSINPQVLWGETCKCQRWIQPGTKYCPYCLHRHTNGKNIGDVLSMQTYILTTNVPIVLKDLWKNGVNSYTIYNFVSSWKDEATGIFYPITSTPLSSLNCPLYRFPIPGDYEAYEFLSSYCDRQVEGVINWEDELTTFDKSDNNLKTLFDDGGFLDEIITYNLYEGLSC